MIVKIELDTEKDTAGSRFSVRPVLSDQEMEKVEAVADELGKNVATVLAIMNMIVYKTFYTHVGVASDVLTFDDLLKNTKEGINYLLKEEGEEHDDSK